jgi:Acetyl esterase (deacetylase)
MRRNSDSVQRTDIQIMVGSERGTEIPTGVIIPEHEEDQKVPLVIVCHGYMGNKDENGFFYGGVRRGSDGGVHRGSNAGVAERLADLGIATVRMSFPGCGDSGESFEFYNNENMISDAERSYEYVLKNYNIDLQRIGLLGWSNGGRIGALFADRHPEVKVMVLWAPAAADGAAMWPDIMRSAGQDYAQLYHDAKKNGRARVILPDKPAGDYLGWEFFRQNEEAKPLEALKNYKGEALMIVPDCDAVVPSWVYNEIIDQTDIKHITITGADHSFGIDTNLPRLTETNLDVTVSYFYRHLMPPDNGL